MKANKGKSLREQFEEEYIATIEPANNRKGFKVKYVYYGNWYLWNLPENDLKAKKTKLLLLVLLDSVLFFLAAALPTDANAYALVAYPGIAAFLAIVLKLIGILQFVLAGRKTSRSNFQDAGRRIRLWSAVQIAACGLAALGCMYYALAYRFFASRLLAVALYAADAAVVFALVRLYSRIPGKVEKNDILDHVTLAFSDAAGGKQHE